MGPSSSAACADAAVVTDAAWDAAKFLQQLKQCMRYLPQSPLLSGVDGSIQAHHVGSGLRMVAHAAQHLKCSGPPLGPSNSTQHRIEVIHIRLNGGCQKQLKNLGSLHPSSTQGAKSSTRVPPPSLKLQRQLGPRVRRLVCVAALECHASLVQAFLNDLCSSTLQHANPSARRLEDTNGPLVFGDFGMPRIYLWDHSKPLRSWDACELYI